MTRLWRVALGASIVAAAAMAFGAGPFASQNPPASAVTLRMIVVSTPDDAARIVEQLGQGADFATLAVEQSIEPTARDGGFLGTLDPATLRPELRDALRGVGTGGLTPIVRIPTGYAVLKVVPASESAGRPAANQLQRLSTSASSVVYAGLSVSGLAEADAVLLAMLRRPGWGEDLQNVCEVRRESIPAVVERLKTGLPDVSGTIEPAALPRDLWIDAMDTQYAWAQLHAYLGEMDAAIALWEHARTFADGIPDALPRLLETLGLAHWHKSELDNGVYRAPGDFCLFPPAPGVNTALPQTASSRKAVEYFEQYLARKPDDLEVKWLLNMAYLTLGGYPSAVPPAHLIPPSAFASGPAAAIGRFKDVAPQAGLNAASLAGGAIVDDFDNDGHLDVLTSSMDVCEPLHFFHNNGDGRFTEKTKEAGLSDQLGGLNLVQADYNNDGCMDVLVLRGGWEFPLRPSLLRNNCNGTFTDVTREAGLPPSVRTQTAAWADVDNDGNVDLFLASEDGPSRLFRNTGRGTFEDVTQKARIDVNAFIKAVVPGDYDNDGFVDFYLTNYEGNNLLFHNNRNGTFTEVGKDAGVQAPWRSFAAWFFDYDNDGWDDLFVTSYYISTDESVRTYLGPPAQRRDAEAVPEPAQRPLRGRVRRGRARQGLDADGRQLRRRQQRRLPGHLPRHGQPVVRLGHAARAAAEPGGEVLRERHGGLRHRRAAQGARHRVRRPRSRRRRGHRRRSRRRGAGRPAPAAAVREPRQRERLDQPAARRREEQSRGDRRPRDADRRRPRDPPHRVERRLVRREPDGDAHRPRRRRARRRHRRSGGRPRTRASGSPTWRRTSSSRSRSRRPTTRDWLGTPTRLGGRGDGAGVDGRAPPDDGRRAQRGRGEAEPVGVVRQRAGRHARDGHDVLGEGRRADDERPAWRRHRVHRARSTATRRTSRACACAGIRASIRSRPSTDSSSC